MAGMQDLSGRIAVITGASRGLGRAIAERLAGAGAGIVAVDLPDAFGALPDGWRAEPLDLVGADAQAQLRELAQALGRVDIVVANAGLVPPWRGMAELDAEEWHRVMTVNVWGVAATIGAFADALAACGRGSAIAMASINGYRAHPKQVLYTASKHAVIGIVRAAALAPGAIATEALLGRVDARHRAGGPAPADALEALARETALRRLATADDVANVAHFLASDASAGMTGSVFPIEAGLS